MNRFSISLAALLLVGGTWLSAEPGPEAKKGGDAGGDVRAEWQAAMQELQAKGFDKQKIRTLMEKMRNGEQLTAEEKEAGAKLRELREKTAARFAGRGGAGMDQARMPSRRGAQFIKVKMNPLDAAYQDLAQAYYSAQKHVEAVDALKIMMEKSPDEETRNAAHFNAATIYRHGLNYYSHAAEEYLKVKGILRSRALRELVDTFQQANDPQLGIDTLTQLADTVENVGEKIDILRTLAYAYTRQGKHDEAIETLKKIPELVTYEQAVELKDYYTPGDPPEVLQGTRQMNPAFGGRQWGGRGDRGRRGGREAEAPAQPAKQ